MPTDALMGAIRDWVFLRERLFDSNWSYDRHLNAAEEKVIAEWRALTSSAIDHEEDDRDG